jgi:hypothetical protein
MPSVRVSPPFPPHAQGLALLWRVNPTDERGGFLFAFASWPSPGENPSRVWGQGRMDSAWDLRAIYNEARLVKDAQDDWCAAAAHARGAAGASELGKYPESPLKLEALVRVLAFLRTSLPPSPFFVESGTMTDGLGAFASSGRDTPRQGGRHGPLLRRDRHGRPRPSLQ